MEFGTKQNSLTWEKIYQTTNFGNTYPTDGLVSLYHHFISAHLKEYNHSLKVLDFGCSHGANAKFFSSLGFDVYGIDISKEAINYCIHEQGFKRQQFIALNILEEERSIYEMFGTFDLIIASECLYYFSKEDCKKILQEFYDCMSENAIIYANMHTWNHHLYREYKNKGASQEGLVQIPSSGLANLPLEVQIISDKDEMRRMFGLFEEIATIRSILEMESENETIHFIGKKTLNQRSS